MKRILIWLLIACIVLFMTACGGKKSDPVDNSSTPTEMPASAPTDTPTETSAEAPTENLTQTIATKQTAETVINTRPSAVKKTKPATAPSKALGSTPTIAPTTVATIALTTAPTTEPTTAPTTMPTSVPIVYRHDEPYSKGNVPEFMALFRQQYPQIAKSSSYDEKDCYNETPPKVVAETSMQFFTFGTGKTLLLSDNIIYVLYSHGFAGSQCDRLVNAVPYDFDGDGVKDLLITFVLDTGGSFINRVSVFNPVTKEFTPLYVWDDGTCDNFLYVTETKAGGQITHTVSRVEWNYEYEKNGDDFELAYKEYTVAGTAGHIEAKDGKPQFVTACPTTYKYQEHYTKENVEEFVDLCYGSNQLNPESPYALTVENCYNVTPPDVAAKTDIQIFQGLGYTLGILLDSENGSEIFPMVGRLVDAVPCDFDEDGKQDVLISSTWGSGVLYHQIEIFNSVTKEFTTLLSSNEISHLESLFLARHAYDIEFVGKTEADYGVSYPVLLADDILENGYTVKHVVVDIIGHIEGVDGKPRFIPSE